MTEQEKIDNAHVLNGLTIHNMVDSDGAIGVLLEGVRDGSEPVFVLTTLKILSGAVEAINKELEKEAIIEE